MGREQRLEGAPLEADALGERRLESAVHGFLRGHHGDERHRSDRFGGLHRLVHQARRRHDARHQARALGFRRIHHAAGEIEVHRLGLADRAREPLRAADARDDAELDLGLAEFRRVGRNDDVALHRELAAAAERETGNRRDHRLAHARNAIPRWEVLLVDVHVALAGHLLDVGAGRERLLRAGDDHAADRVVRLECVDRGGHVGIHLRIERVQRLRAVEADDADLALGLDDDGFVAHELPPDHMLRCARENPACRSRRRTGAGCRRPWWRGNRSSAARRRPHTARP